MAGVAITVVVVPAPGNTVASIDLEQVFHEPYANAIAVGFTLALIAGFLTILWSLRRMRI